MKNGESKNEEFRIKGKIKKRDWNAFCNVGQMDEVNALMLRQGWQR